MLVTALICLITSCGVGNALTSAPIRYELANGLRVILRPIAGAEQTAVLTLFSIGGDHDPAGQSGLAHFIEHLYVTAAAGTHQARTAEDLMRAYPAGWNAQTGDDYTVFATVVDSSQVEAEIRHHADRLGDLRITEADLRRELPRIDQELANMFGGIPAIAAANLARERVRPTPHGGRKGGRIEQLRHVTLPQLQKRWQTFYKPPNALIVVAGGFDPAHIRTSIASAFSSLPSGEVVPSAQPPDDVKPAEAQFIEVKPIQVGMQATAALTFLVPRASSRDYSSLIVLVSRFMQQTPVTAFNQNSTEPAVRFAMLDDPNVFSAVATLRADETVEQVAARLREFVAKAVAHPLQPAERQLAKQSLAFFLDTIPLPDAVLKNNVYGTAFSLGRRAQLGIDGEALAKKIDRVRPADFKRIVEKYFSPNNGAVVAVGKTNSY
jgi:zinc protease